MIEEFPEIDVVGVGSRASSEALRDHLLGSPLEQWPHIDDSSESLWSALGARGRSTFVFIDRGNLRWFDFGDLGPTELRHEFDLLARAAEVASVG